jgi:hypothetical protein
MASPADPIANLVSMLFAGLPEYYVNQNDEWTLHQPVLRLYYPVYKRYIV